LNGIVPRRHGNKMQHPWHASTITNKRCAVNFIKNIAETHALPLPGRMPKFYDFNIMLLPTHFTKANVHQDYVLATKALEKKSQKTVRCFGYKEFCRLWSEIAPYI